MVYSLPYIEQDNLYKVVPWETQYNSGGVFRGTAQYANARFKTLRCPSDAWNMDQRLSNYAGSLGPQCADGGCGYNPHQQFCTTAAGWGYATSPDHGNSFTASDIRGMYNRLGAKINMASAKDGTSNTILIGEVLPSDHDHYWDGSWTSFNGGASHHTTIIPINYKSDDRTSGRCSNPARIIGNWNVSWGFKSNHTGGAQFVFVDGSVHFLSQSIDHRTYQLLGCRDDGQVPGNY